MAAKRTSNITSFRKKWSINIGVFIFGVVFIYLAVTVLMYLTGKHISAYEVREGSILKDNAYTGFIVRQEEVVLAEEDGYVNYFAPEGYKAGAKTYVYSLSSKPLKLPEADGGGHGELSAEEQETLLIKTQDFAENFHGENFGDVYTLKNNISSVLESKSNQSRQEQLNALLTSGTEGLHGYAAGNPGIVIYGTDGYEEISLSDVTVDMISKQNYESVTLKNNSQVKAGEPVYKVITDDTWTIVILLDDETAQELFDTERIRVQFQRDHETAVADFSIYNTEDANLAFLTFDSSMVRYAQERYLDIELILEDESGLKIPKSSAVKKDFYVVPEGYITQGGNTKEDGVLVLESSGKAVFKKTEIYYRDNENGLVYLDPNAFDQNTTLVKSDSEETCSLKEKKPLQGVYNINKGYAVFKEIEILCESEEYYIVETGSNYGLANYDHIALVGKDVQENDVVF